MARKISKREANYRPSTDPDRQCFTCAHFFVNGGRGLCSVVNGLIDPSFDSDLWTPDFFPTIDYIGTQGNLRAA